jgi:hypothetical protein
MGVTSGGFASQILRRKDEATSLRRSEAYPSSSGKGKAWCARCPNPFPSANCDRTISSIARKPYLIADKARALTEDEIFGKSKKASR